MDRDRRDNILIPISLLVLSHSANDESQSGTVNTAEAFPAMPHRVLAMEINMVPFHHGSHDILLYRRIQRCRLSGKGGLLDGFFSLNLAFSKVEI